MKRSEINRIIRDAENFMMQQNFRLPPWGHYSHEDWKEAAADNMEEIFSQHLGWDVTDMGSGNFERCGLVLFTVRNGGIGGNSKPYAEKIMIVQESQETAMHLHKTKIEDIINRGGGNLVLELFNSDQNGELLETDVEINIDGVKRVFSPGEKVVLTPGESICLRQGIYHRFYGQQGCGTVLAGEVSSINDDSTDNYFYETLPRYPELEEDESPYRLLCIDYGNFLPIE